MRRLQFNPLPSMLNDDLWRSSDVDLSRFHRKTTYPQPHFPPKPVIPRYTHKLDNCIFTLPLEYRAREPIYPTPGLRQSRVAYFVQPIDFKLKDIVVRIVGNNKTCSVVFPTDLYLTDRTTIYGLIDYIDSVNNNFRQPGDYKSHVPDIVCNSQFDGISTVPLTLLPLRLPRIHMDWVITPTGPYWCWTLYTGPGKDEFGPHDPAPVLYHHGGAYTNPLCKSMSNAERGHCYLRQLDVIYFRFGTREPQRLKAGQYHGSFPGSWDRDMSSDPNDKLPIGFFGKRTTALIQELEHTVDTLSFYSGPIFHQWIEGLCQDFEDGQHSDPDSDEFFNTESRYIAQFEEMLRTVRISANIRIGAVEKDREEQMKTEAKWNYRSQSQATPTSKIPPLSLLDTNTDFQQPDSLEKEIRACSLSDRTPSSMLLPKCTSFPSKPSLPKGAINDTACTTTLSVISPEQPSSSENFTGQTTMTALLPHKASSLSSQQSTSLPSQHTGQASLNPQPPRSSLSLPITNLSKAQRAQVSEEQRTDHLAAALQATLPQETAHAARTATASPLEHLNTTVSRFHQADSRSSSPNTTVISYTQSDHHTSHYDQPHQTFSPTITPDTLLYQYRPRHTDSLPAHAHAHDTEAVKRSN